MEDQDATPTGGLGRRDFVKRSALLGGMVWAAPAMSTLGPRAFGQPQEESPFIVDDDCEGGVIVRFQFRVTDGTGQFEACDTSLPACFPGDNTAATWNAIGNCVSPQADPKNAEFNGNFVINGSASADESAKTVRITVQNPPGSSIFLNSAAGGDDGGSDRCEFAKEPQVTAPDEIIFSFGVGSPQVDIDVVRGVFCYFPPED